MNIKAIQKKTTKKQRHMESEVKHMYENDLEGDRRT